MPLRPVLPTNFLTPLILAQSVSILERKTGSRDLRLRRSDIRRVGAHNSRVTARFTDDRAARTTRKADFRDAQGVGYT